MVLQKSAVHSSGLSFGTLKNANRPYLSHAVGDVNSFSKNQLCIYLQFITCRCAHSFRNIQEPFKNFGCLKGYKSHTEDQQL